MVETLCFGSKFDIVILLFMRLSAPAAASEKSAFPPTEMLLARVFEPVRSVAAVPDRSTCGSFRLCSFPLRLHMNSQSRAPFPVGSFHMPRLINAKEHFAGQRQY